MGDQLGRITGERDVAHVGKIPANCRRCLLQFYNRRPRIGDSFGFRAGHVKLMPERKRRK